MNIFFEEYNHLVDDFYLSSFDCQKPFCSSDLVYQDLTLYDINDLVFIGEMVLDYASCFYSIDPDDLEQEYLIRFFNSFKKMIKFVMYTDFFYRSKDLESRYDAHFLHSFSNRIYDFKDWYQRFFKDIKKEV